MLFQKAAKLVVGEAEGFGRLTVAADQIADDGDTGTAIGFRPEMLTRLFGGWSVGHQAAQDGAILSALSTYIVLQLVVFVVAPQAATPGWATTLARGALFGFFAYATYDLTNLATLKGWPVGVALLDMAWGAALSAVAATAGKLALDRWAPTSG